jgi:hypothetical protein
MSQLPITPSNPPTDGTVQPALSQEPARSDASATELQAISFQRTIEEVLESPQTDPQTLLSWSLNLPIAPMADASPLQAGNVLPSQVDSLGEDLPLSWVQGGFLQAKAIKPAEAVDTGDGVLLTQTPGKTVTATLDQLTRGDLSESRLAMFDSVSEAATSGHSLPAGMQATGGVLAVRSPSLVLPLEIPVGQPGWDKAMGEKIQWMVGRHIQTAEVKLTPPNLGPLEIRVSLQHDQTSVNFVAPQAPTREAIEAALPRLREMLGEAHLNLVDVNVGQGKDTGSSQQGMHERTKSVYPGGGEPAPPLEEPSICRLASSGMVDDYA